MHPYDLMNGPRGLRLLLAYALLSERLAQPDYSKFQLIPAVANAAYELDSGRGRSRVMVGSGEGDPILPTVTPDDVADLLGNVPLAVVTPELLRIALQQSVDSARYWQEPDGEDVLTAVETVTRSLYRVARHIVESPHSYWWTSGCDMGDQWTTQWEEDSASRPGGHPAEILAQWRRNVLERETRAEVERDFDPDLHRTGIWWSIPPPFKLLDSSRTLVDGVPAGLWWSEDAAGFRYATTRRVYLPKDVRVLEIDGAAAWANLCQRFPIDVSAEKRYDWYYTTGRVGRWVMPDWSFVAQEYDGVHLTVAGYLAAAGTAIPINDDTASVIAGWSPDQTWWFIHASRVDDPVSWNLEFDSVLEEYRWIRTGQE